MMNRTYVNIINPATGLRPYPQFGQIDCGRKMATSDFDGLQFPAQRNLSRGWLVTANYMWSHSINDGSLGSGVEDDFPENVACRGANILHRSGCPPDLQLVVGV